MHIRSSSQCQGCWQCCMMRGSLVALLFVVWLQNAGAHEYLASNMQALSEGQFALDQSFSASDRARLVRRDDSRWISSHQDASPSSLADQSALAAYQEFAQLKASRQVAKQADSLKLAFVVTLLSLDPRYAEMIRVLHASLVRVAKRGEKYKTGKAAFVALVPYEMKEYRDCLRKIGFDDVVVVNKITPCPRRDPGFLNSMYTRLNLWNMTQYDRLVSLDADMVVMQNIDELFEYNLFAATHDWPRGFLGKPSCACRSVACRGKVPGLMDHFEYSKEERYMNSGLMVVQPSADTIRRMAEYLSKWNLKADDAYDNVTCQPSEQRFLGDFFTLEHGGDGWFPLSDELYNVRLALVQTVPQSVQTPKILHYTDKPMDHKVKSGNPLEEWFFEQWFKLNRTAFAPLPCTWSPPPFSHAPQHPMEIADFMGTIDTLLTPAEKTARDQKCIYTP